MTKAEMAAKLASKCDLSQGKAGEIIDYIRQSVCPRYALEQMVREQTGE